MYCVGRREGKEFRLAGTFLCSPDEQPGFEKSKEYLLEETHCIVGGNLTELLILVED